MHDHDHQHDHSKGDVEKSGQQQAGNKGGSVGYNPVNQAGVPTGAEQAGQSGGQRQGSDDMESDTNVAGSRSGGAQDQRSTGGSTDRTMRDRTQR